MENQWYGQFNFDQVEQIREKAQDDYAVRAHILETTGNNYDLVDMILEGPDEDQLNALKNAGPDDRIHEDFDNLWGAGAAEYYASYNPNDVWDHLAEIPGAAARGPFGSIAETGEWLFNLRGTADEAAREAGQSYAEYVAAQRGEDAPESAPVLPYDEKEWDADTILRGAIKKPETMTGQVVEGLSQFVAPFMVSVGAIGKLKVIANSGTKGKLAAATVAGFMTDYAAFDEDEPLITTAIADYFEIESQIVDDYFRHHEDDSDAEKRFRRAVEGAGLGIATDVVMMGVARAVRRLRRGDIDADEARSEVEKILDEVETEALDIATSPEVGQMVPRSISAPSETALWHFEGTGVVSRERPAAEAAVSAEREAEQLEQPSGDIESAAPRMNEATEALTGEPVSKPTVSKCCCSSVRARYAYDRQRRR